MYIKPSEERWSAPLDGKDYPIAHSRGMPDDVTWAGRQSGPRAISFVLKRKGRPVQFATLTVAPDGRTLEVVQVNGESGTRETAIGSSTIGSIVPGEMILAGKLLDRLMAAPGSMRMRRQTWNVTA